MLSHGEGQTPCIEPAQRIPRVLTFQHVVKTLLPPQALRKQMSSSLRDTRQWPTALWVIGELGRQRRDLWTRACFGANLLLDERLTHVLADGQVIDVKRAT